MSSNKKGFFLCLEGIDGAGKTTLREWIVEWFKSQGITPVVTREPGGTPLAEKIRNIILAERDEHMPPMAETHLFMAARSVHLENLVKPRVEAGDLVISDRFCDSTFCYQGAGRGIPLGQLITMHEMSFGRTYPDLTLVLDGRPEVFRERMAARGEQGLNHFDHMGQEFHDASRAMYRGFAEQYPERYALIDAEQPFDQVCSQVITHLMRIDGIVRRRPEVN